MKMLHILSEIFEKLTPDFVFKFVHFFLLINDYQKCNEESAHDIPANYFRNNSILYKIVQAHFYFIQYAFLT